MRWKGPRKRNRLLFLSTVPVATLAIIFILQATMHTSPLSTSPLGPTNPALLTSSDGSDILQPLSGTSSSTPAANFTGNQIANDSPVMQILRGTDSEMVDGDSPSTHFADNSGIDSSHATNAEELVYGPERTGPDTSADDFIPILLANNAYPKYDYDFEAIQGRGDLSAGQALENVAPDTSSGGVDNEPLSSHAPEPATMLLLGSALVGVAVFGRKLRKS